MFMKNVGNSYLTSFYNGAISKDDINRQNIFIKKYS